MSDVGVWGPERTKDKVMIVGANRDSTGGQIKLPALHLAADYEVWGINEIGIHWPEDLFDRYFELHRFDQFSTKKLVTPMDRLALLERLADAGAVVYVNDDLETCVSPSVSFPFDQLQAMYQRGNYHAGSVDWLIELAVVFGFSEIRLEGMASFERESPEPRSSRACIEYWLGFAEGSGVKVVVNEGALLLRNIERDNGLYPLDDVSPSFRLDHLFGTIFQSVIGTIIDSANIEVAERMKADTQNSVGFTDD